MSSRGLKDQVQKTLSKVADDDIEQNGLKTWVLALCQVYQQKRGGFEVKAYPAIVDAKTASRLSSMRLKWSKICDAQRAATLNFTQCAFSIKYLHNNLPNKSKLGLYFNPYGKVMDLIDD